MASGCIAQFWYFAYSWQYCEIGAEEDKLSLWGVLENVQASDIRNQMLMRDFEKEQGRL
jgi:hypothetical protein